MTPYSARFRPRRSWSVNSLSPRAIPLMCVQLGGPALAWKAPRYCISNQARAAFCRRHALGEHSSETALAEHRAAETPRTHVHSKRRFSSRIFAHPTQKKDALRRRLDAGSLVSGPSRASMSLWLRKPLPPKPALRPRSACQRRPQSRAPFFTVCASSATTCFALPPISSMQNSVLPVTKGDLRPPPPPACE